MEEEKGRRIRSEVEDDDDDDDSRLKNCVSQILFLKFLWIFFLKAFLYKTFAIAKNKKNKEKINLDFNVKLM